MSLERPQLSKRVAPSECELLIDGLTQALSDTPIRFGQVALALSDFPAPMEGCLLFDPRRGLLTVGELEVSAGVKEHTLRAHLVAHWTDLLAFSSELRRCLEPYLGDSTALPTGATVLLRGPEELARSISSSPYVLTTREFDDLPNHLDRVFDHYFAPLLSEKHAFDRALLDHLSTVPRVRAFRDERHCIESFNTFHRQPRPHWQLL